MYELFYKLYEQFRISIANLKNQPLLPAYPEHKHGSESFEVSRSAGLITRKEQDEVVLNTFIQLKNLFEVTITLCAEEFHCGEEEVITRVKKASARHNQLKKYISDCEATDDLKEKPFRKVLETDKLETCNMFQEKMVEFFIKQCDWELHLSKLQEENVLVKEQISGLEDVLRYMMNERESSRLALQNSESHDRVSRLRLEGWRMKRSCKRLELHATSESLVKEKNLLQKSNGELRKQNADLKELCTVLKAELKELQKVFSDMLKEVEALEANEGHKEKLAQEESLLNQLHSETTIEVENPQRTASKDALGIDQLCMDKTWLEAALEEVQGKVKFYESKLEILQMESETKVLRFICELSTSKQKQKILIADFEKVQKMLEDAKANEEKLDNILTRLELRLKALEYEGQKLAEEVSCLKVQLQSSEVHQDEVFALRR
ncbi:hypothetical protein TIFTF001_021963 [Ficus carica]|uniref:Uncharacterized protein n=1 Tax=Ficus carica TaxID=3494 RepID=A0AA88AIH0_FICCA|nr:hypothetical protein TIFTF001_021963 [Ficus carica]